MSNKMPAADSKALAALTKAVMSVGKGCRGFVVNLDVHGSRGVITAAHCLRKLPPRHPGHYANERTWPLLGPLGGKRTKPAVWAECLFVELMSDIAVLGKPSHTDYSDEAEAYDELMNKLQPLAIGDAPPQGRESKELPDTTIEYDTPGEGRVRLLSLENEWFEMPVRRIGEWLSIETKGLVACGMSGSPIVSMDGRAIGLISTGDKNPTLIDNLPKRLLSNMILACDEPVAQ